MDSRVHREGQDPLVNLEQMVNQVLSVQMVHPVCLECLEQMVSMEKPDDQPSVHHQYLESLAYPVKQVNLP